MSFCTIYLSRSSKAAGFAVDHCSNSLQVMMKEVIRSMKEPFKFSSYHQAVRSPFDYYTVSSNFCLANSTILYHLFLLSFSGQTSFSAR